MESKRDFIEELSRLAHEAHLEHERERAEAWLGFLETHPEGRPERDKA